MIFQKQATEPQRLSELVKLNSDIFFYLSFLFFNYLDLSKDVSMILLQAMPPGVNMDMGKGYDNNDRLCRSSLSQCLMW